MNTFELVLLMKIQLINHACLKVESSGKIIYFDPYKIPKDEEKADVIVISHDHHDHFDKKSVKNIIKNNTQIYCPTSCKSILSSFKAKGLKPGDYVKIENIDIQAVPAYTTNKQTHPKNNQWLGYIVKDGTLSLYHAGDTELMPEMKEFTGIDYALIPVGGTYTMDFDEAIRAIKTLKPNNVVPIHTWGKDLANFERMMKEALPGISVIKLNPGDTFTK